MERGSAVESFDKFPINDNFLIGAGAGLPIGLCLLIALLLTVWKQSDSEEHLLSQTINRTVTDNDVDLKSHAHC